MMIAGLDNSYFEKKLFKLIFRLSPSNSYDWSPIENLKHTTMPPMGQAWQVASLWLLRNLAVKL